MKIFAYMINPVTVFSLTETGQLVERKKIGDAIKAKEYLQSPGFHQMAVHAVGGSAENPGYDLIWEDDPAGNDEVIEAAKKFDLRERGEYVEEQVKENKPDSDTVGSGDAVTVPKIPTEEVIEVDAAVTHTEQVMRGMILDLEALKAEAAGVQAEYNKKIKDLMKQLFDYAHGKSKTYVKCVIEYNWEAGIRAWVRTDTGEIVKTEDIPDSMRQIKLNLDQGKPDEPETPVANSEPTEEPQSESEPELDTSEVQEEAVS